MQETEPDVVSNTGHVEVKFHEESHGGTGSGDSTELADQVTRSA